MIADTGKQIKEAELLLNASSLAYITILSIIPLLAVSFSIFQAFGGMQKLYAVIEPLIIQNLAEGSDEHAMTAIRGFISNIHAGALGAGGLVALIFTSMSMLSNAEKAINRVWRAPFTRTLFQRVASYWLFITLGPLALAFAVGFATTQDYPISRFLPNGGGIFIITTAIFYFIYKYVPHRHVNPRAAGLAAVVTAIGWNIARLAYQIYNRNVMTYNKIYGSLGAIPILLLWIYILWLIVLSGAALTVAIQKRFDPL